MQTKKKWRVFSTQTINYLNVFGVPKTIFLCNSILSLAEQKKKEFYYENNTKSFSLIFENG